MRSQESRVLYQKVNLKCLTVIEGRKEEQEEGDGEGQTVWAQSTGSFFDL